MEQMGMVSIFQFSSELRWLNTAVTGNPIGGLVFSSAFGQLQQIPEWTVCFFSSYYNCIF